MFFKHFSTFHTYIVKSRVKQKQAYTVLDSLIYCFMEKIMAKLETKYCEENCKSQKGTLNINFSVKLD